MANGSDSFNEPDQNARGIICQKRHYIKGQTTRGTTGKKPVKTDVPQKLELKVFSGSGEYDFYEEDEAHTKFYLSETVESGKIVQTVKIVENKQPEKSREYFIKFSNIRPDRAEIKVNGEEVGSYPYEECLAIKIKRKKRLEIKVKYEKEDELHKLLRTAANIITRVQGDNEKKVWFNRLRLKLCAFSEWQASKRKKL